MNKAKFSTTFLVLLGLLVFLPIFTAATPSITDISVKLTADYGKFADDHDDFIDVATESFTVTNDGSQSITVKAVGLPSKYQSESVIVPAETTKTVSLNIEVPHRKSPGEEKIGTIVIVDANNVQLDNADLIQETASLLQLEKLEVKYTDFKGKSQKDEFNSDDNTYPLEQEVRPYTDITFNFNMQNLFDRDYNDKGELSSVELAIDLDDSDLFEKGFQDTYQFENIEAGKEGKFTVTLPISKEIGADTYTIKFTLTAEDGEGIEYEIQKEVEVEIQLDDNDIRIVKAKIVPETLTICEKEASLEVEVHNFGSDDQDKVMVALQNAELGLLQKIEKITIDSHTKDDDHWQKTFTIPLENTKTKTYFLDLKTYLGSTLTDAEVIQLELKPCTAEKPAAEEKKEETPPAKPGTETAKKPAAGPEEVTGSVVKSVEKIPYTSNDYLVALMLIAIAVAAAMIVLMLVILFKEKNN